MLEEVLNHLHNWFQLEVYPGTYTIEDGSIALPCLLPGQYFRIVGSVFNDGLHQYGPQMEVLRDETFDGAIWALAIPKAVVELADEIAAWQEKYKDALESPYASESFGGYSYTKAGGANEAGGSGGWQEAFRKKLNPYRKVR